MLHLFPIKSYHKQNSRTRLTFASSIFIEVSSRCNRIASASNFSSQTQEKRFIKRTVWVIKWLRNASVLFWLIAPTLSKAK